MLNYLILHILMALTSATYFTLLRLESVSFTSQVYKNTLFSINYIALSCPVYSSLKTVSTLSRNSTIAAESQRMLTRWSRAISQIGRVNSELGRQLCSLHCRDYSKVAAVAEPPADKLYNVNDQVNLNKMFWSKPHSLALAPDSPFRVEDPQYEGFKRALFKLMLFYSKQSKSIRGANVIYRRVVHQVDRPAIYDVFSLEKTFKTTFSLLVIHMWLCLRRLKQDGKDGVELGQYLYEIYNHDVELRVSKAGVNLLLIKWMKDLEKIFYGNIVAYDAAMLPEAKQEELQNVIWRNVFSDDGTSTPSDAALLPVQAMSRYVRRESNCLSFTDKEAMFSGNFMFTSLGSTTAGTV